jgi:putative membrane-bound dehydrogenase-like protein
MIRLTLGLLILLAGLAALQFGAYAQKANDIHDPHSAVANLEVHPELEATLFASEADGITNPVNLDIDHRGRVWICDVKNYRGNNGKRPEGDRIMILEDKNGDGKADSVKTFYQGRDIDSAMGICVLGNRVIVSATPNVFVFHFDENDKITKRETLFSKTGQPQHDHSAHSFVFGPDGRLYWNFGNTGHAVHDKDGNLIVDLAGNKVNDSGKPYRNGMVFRMDTPWLKTPPAPPSKGGAKRGAAPPSQGGANSQSPPLTKGGPGGVWPDAAKGPGAGVNFEVLAHNFRNNYEVCVDSFGTMWQSDNDDDGNRGVRINYVMEYGNYGYVDEMTGAGWRTKRTNLEKTVPEQHWHLNDPGVVPTLLLTGAGSPCGITVYEGTLLPKVFHGQMIHADAGPSVVRAYPVVKDGAGYKATETVSILDGSKKNNWFRPADVCVAPDGSLFVTDWYDPGVGGHAQRDLDRGRIFRVAPKSTQYSVPKYDFKTADGAVEALKSPNLAVRYLAWTALHHMGAKAEAALLKAWRSDDLRLRARALWLLGHIPGEGDKYIHQLLHDPDPDLRITTIRLGRQRNFDKLRVISRAMDKDAAVRRECAIALRNYADPYLAVVWADLAKRHDGRDRWYLEALGIGADKTWDECLDSFIAVFTLSANNKANRDILWRSRAPRTPDLLRSFIVDKDTPTAELPRLLRAFDFQKPSPQKDAALVKLAFGNVGDDERQAFISGEAIMRLQSFDIKTKPEHAAALNKLLDRSKGMPMFVELVAKFNVTDRYADLLALAQQKPGEQVGVDAMRVLLDRNGDEPQVGVDSKDNAVALATVEAIGNAAHTAGVHLLAPIVTEPKRDLELRRQATRAMGKSRNGAMRLVKLAESKKLPKELHAAAGAVLHSAQWRDVKDRAAQLFPLPAGKNNAPLPLIVDLVKMKGSVQRGKLAFAKVGTCANCHQVNGEGKEVGPDLSEIGKKLGKEALYESILYPSAGISHNFETWVIETSKGENVQGILMSQTPAEVTIKNSDALLRTFKRGEIDVMAKSPISLMPADLNKNLTPQDLADVVEYMLTLREAKKQ